MTRNELIQTIEERITELIITKRKFGTEIVDEKSGLLKPEYAEAVIEHDILKTASRDLQNISVTFSKE